VRKAIHVCTAVFTCTLAVSAWAAPPNQPNGQRLEAQSNALDPDEPPTEAGAKITPAG